MTLSDTETHSRLEIETLLFNAIRYHAIRSLNFTVAVTYLEVLRMHLPRHVSVRPHHDSHFAREERGEVCVEMRPEGSAVDCIGRVSGTVISLTPSIT